LEGYGNRKEDGGDNRPTIKEEVRMRFAIPTYQGKLCSHFGHCEAFAIIEVDEEGRILSETYIQPPPHAPGVIPRWLKEKGVDKVIASGMGPRAQMFFSEMGIEVIIGAVGEDPKELVKAYLNGTLVTGPNVCEH
jgi:predicted Fe-Mo cluster-binding NifX family protein